MVALAPVLQHLELIEAYDALISCVITAFGRVLLDSDSDCQSPITLLMLHADRAVMYTYT